jgi:hypothetical protein
MRYFIKNPELGHVTLPDVGMLEEGTVLVGERFAQYSPKFLTEVPNAPTGVPLESREPRTGPVLLTEPAPVGPHLGEQGTSDEDPGLLQEGSSMEQVKRGRGRPRKNPLPG